MLMYEPRYAGETTAARLSATWLVTDLPPVPLRQVHAILCTAGQAEVAQLLVLLEAARPYAAAVRARRLQPLDKERMRNLGMWEVMLPPQI